VSKYSVFKLDAASASDGLFYNTGFGVEGSPGANIMIGAAILLVLIIGLAARRGEKKDYWQEMEESAGERKHIWEIVVLAVLAVLAVAVIGLMIYISRNSESIRKRLEEYQAQSSAAVPVRVLILARNEAGDLTDDIHGEAQYFYEAYLEGGQEYDISGDQEGCRLYIKDGAALYITGTGKVNAALNLQALLTDPGFDFSDAYILSAGSALSAAEYGVPGDVYVITAAVDYDRGRANVTQDPDTSAAVTLNTDLADHCYELVKEVKLETTESTRTFMKEGFGNKKWARRRPKVKTGTSVGGESFMRGEEDHSQALLMTQNSGCRDPYAAMGPEDAALAQVLQRADLLDRFVILRAGIETDLYAKGENTDKAASSAKELPGTADIYETAMKNSFYVGRILIDAFLKETEKAAGAQAAAR
jgi:purine nucleoside permease